MPPRQGGLQLKYHPALGMFHMLGDQCQVLIDSAHASDTPAAVKLLVSAAADTADRVPLMPKVEFRCVEMLALYRPLNPSRVANRIAGGVP